MRTSRSRCAAPRTSRLSSTPTRPPSRSGPSSRRCDPAARAPSSPHCPPSSSTGAGSSKTARSTCTASPTAPRSSSDLTRPGASASPCAAPPGTAGTRRPTPPGNPAVYHPSGPTANRLTTASRGTSPAAATRWDTPESPRDHPWTARGTHRRVPTTPPPRLAHRICPAALTWRAKDWRWATGRSSPARARGVRTSSATRRARPAPCSSPWMRNLWRGTTREAATSRRRRAKAYAKGPASARAPAGRLPRTCWTTTGSPVSPRRRSPTSGNSSTARMARTSRRFTASWARSRRTCTARLRLRRWARTSFPSTRCTRSRSSTSGSQTPTATRVTSSCKSPRMAT
mmetsp:Transcript_10179/g.28364  ORF Transcript_10179/g.28364 Transcript_10179/m.28364 type:complete len:343 (-) Transcript_10179:781-1809(-)